MTVAFVENKRKNERIVDHVIQKRTYAFEQLRLTALVKVVKNFVS